jgi:hypothetical protein
MKSIFDRLLDERRPEFGRDTVAHRAFGCCNRHSLERGHVRRDKIGSVQY